MPTPSYEDLQGSPTFNFGYQSSSAQRKLKCAWTDKFTLAQIFLGKYYPFGGGTGSLFAYPGLSNLLVDNVEIAPFPQDIPHDGDSPANYNYALLTVNYKTPDKKQEDGKNPTVSLKATAGAEILTLPGSGVFWDVTSVPADSGLSTKVSEDVSAGILMPTVEYTRRYQAFNTVPWTAIRATIGTVNSTPYLDVDAGYLLFIGAEVEQDWQADGTLRYNYEMKFSERSQQWVKFYRPGVGWRKLYLADRLAGGGMSGISLVPLYRSADFSVLDA